MLSIKRPDFCSFNDSSKNFFCRPYIEAEQRTSAVSGQLLWRMSPFPDRLCSLNGR
jgi:hypothetical protein